MLVKKFTPVIIKDGRKYYLQYSYEHEVDFINIPIEEQKVVAVDLGINNSAVCSLMTSNGTVLKKRFINQSREKDRQCHLINRLKRKQKEGYRKDTNDSLWSKINGLNTHIANDTVNKIINFAIEYGATTIVFEYLNFKGKKLKGSNNIAPRLQLWAKRTIQHKVEHKAHCLGLRVSRINPKNTSALAYDGSGYIKRDKSNASLCTFANKKKYNTDLSASYNIGARYFIREINKTMSVKKWSQVLAKVPELSVRTQCTLATLYSLVAVL